MKLLSFPSSMLTICLMVGLNFGSDRVQAIPSFVSLKTSSVLYSSLNLVSTSSSNGLFRVSKLCTRFTNNTSGCLKSAAIYPLTTSSTTTPKL
ncbi:hypothetical protein EPI10_020852 [Gossypium australe]|uniref:Secreted protein n=1 Tax=Gossypium australe TaxID=47621 RepID=A0A5B6WG59_9ROSI|nr:hypothetical protein EPI10_020852 [Gossypium australe]